MKKRRDSALWILGVVIVLAAAMVFLSALGNLESGQDESGRQQLEDSIRRAAVACYATEGFYPPDLDYIVAHYGLQIDGERYAVFYEAFAENLMPEITVVSID